MRLGVTGHRPPDLGGYSDEAFQLLVTVAKEQLTRILPEEVITGMALGWDQAVALACWEMSIPYAAYIPFEEQAKAWPKSSRFQWATLRDHASREVVVGGKKYSLEAMHARNQRVVEDSEVMLANYNGYPYSGTAHAIGLAEKRGIQIINVYPNWKERFRESGIVNEDG